MELPLASALAGALLLLALAAFLVRRAAGGKSLLLSGKQAKGGLRVDATSGDGANAAAAAAAASSKGGSAASPRPQVTLLFGTQTGTAERFAKQLKTELLAISSGGSASHSARSRLGRSNGEAKSRQNGKSARKRRVSAAVKG